MLAASCWSSVWCSMWRLAPWPEVPPQQTNYRVVLKSQFAQNSGSFISLNAGCSLMKWADPPSVVETLAAFSCSHYGASSSVTDTWRPHPLPSPHCHRHFALLNQRDQCRNLKQTYFGGLLTYSCQLWVVVFCLKAPKFYFYIKPPDDDVCLPALEWAEHRRCCECEV